MKEKVKTESLRCTRKILESKLKRQLIRDSEDIADIKSWCWLRNGH